MKRIANVARLYLVNTRSMLWVPVVVLASAWVITLLIFKLVSSQGAAEGAMVSGGIQAPLWYTLALGITGMNLLFPFSQALGITRREFVLGSGFAAAVYSATLALVLVLGGLAEQATDAFGIGGYFFYLPWVWADGWFGAWLLFFSLSTMFFIVGFTLASVYKRYGALWLTIALALMTIALIGIIWIVTTTGSWMRLFAWFAGFGPLSSSLVLAGVTLVVGGLAYLTLRRMVVR